MRCSAYSHETTDSGQRRSGASLATLFVVARRVSHYGHRRGAVMAAVHEGAGGAADNYVAARPQSDQQVALAGLETAGSAFIRRPCSKIQSCSTRPQSYAVLLPDSALDPVQVRHSQVARTCHRDLSTAARGSASVILACNSWRRSRHASPADARAFRERGSARSSSCRALPALDC